MGCRDVERGGELRARLQIVPPVGISVVPELVQMNVVRRSVHSEHERELNEPLF